MDPISLSPRNASHSGIPIAPYSDSPSLQRNSALQLTQSCDEQRDTRIVKTFIKTTAHKLEYPQVYEQLSNKSLFSFVENSLCSDKEFIKVFKQLLFDTLSDVQKSDIQGLSTWEAMQHLLFVKGYSWPAKEKFDNRFFHIALMLDVANLLLKKKILIDFSQEKNIEPFSLNCILLFADYIYQVSRCKRDEAELIQLFASNKEVARAIKIALDKALSRIKEEPLEMDKELIRASLTFAETASELLRESGLEPSFKELFNNGMLDKSLPPLRKNKLKKGKAIKGRKEGLSITELPKVYQELLRENPPPENTINESLFTAMLNLAGCLAFDGKSDCKKKYGEFFVLLPLCRYLLDMQCDSAPGEAACQAKEKGGKLLIKLMETMAHHSEIDGKAPENEKIKAPLSLFTAIAKEIILSLKGEGLFLCHYKELLGSIDSGSLRCRGSIDKVIEVQRNVSRTYSYIEAKYIPKGTYQANRFSDANLVAAIKPWEELKKTMDCYKKNINHYKKCSSLTFDQALRIFTYSAEKLHPIKKINYTFKTFPIDFQEAPILAFDLESSLFRSELLDYLESFPLYSKYSPDEAKKKFNGDLRLLAIGATEILHVNLKQEIMPLIAEAAEREGREMNEEAMVSLALSSLEIAGSLEAIFQELISKESRAMSAPNEHGSLQLLRSLKISAGAAAKGFSPAKRADSFSRYLAAFTQLNSQIKNVLHSIFVQTVNSLSLHQEAMGMIPQLSKREQFGQQSITKVHLHVMQKLSQLYLNEYSEFSKACKIENLAHSFFIKKCDSDEIKAAPSRARPTPKGEPPPLKRSKPNSKEVRKNTIDFLQKIQKELKEDNFDNACKLVEESFPG